MRQAKISFPNNFLTSISVEKSLIDMQIGAQARINGVVVMIMYEKACAGPLGIMVKPVKKNKVVRATRSPSPKRRGLNWIFIGKLLVCHLLIDGDSHPPPHRPRMQPDREPPIIHLAMLILLSLEFFRLVRQKRI